jgi:Na+(H+)/acetate symporter ActP
MNGLMTRYVLTGLGFMFGLACTPHVLRSIIHKTPLDTATAIWWSAGWTTVAILCL